MVPPYVGMARKQNGRSIIAFKYANISPGGEFYASEGT